MGTETATVVCNSHKQAVLLHCYQRRPQVWEPSANLFHPIPSHPASCLGSAARPEGWSRRRQLGGRDWTGDLCGSGRLWMWPAHGAAGRGRQTGAAAAAAAARLLGCSCRRRYSAQQLPVPYGRRPRPLECCSDDRLGVPVLGRE